VISGDAFFGKFLEIGRFCSVFGTAWPGELWGGPKTGARFRGSGGVGFEGGVLEGGSRGWSRGGPGEGPPGPPPYRPLFTGKQVGNPGQSPGSGTGLPGIRGFGGSWCPPQKRGFLALFGHLARNAPNPGSDLTHYPDLTPRLTPGLESVLWSIKYNTRKVANLRLFRATNGVAGRTLGIPVFRSSSSDRLWGQMDHFVVSMTEE